MTSNRIWGADDGPSLLMDPGTTNQGAGVRKLIDQCRNDLATARERLGTARELLAQVRRIRHPMVPTPCRCPPRRTGDDSRASSKG
ncbi:MAG TPA: hypothetical protein VIL30_08895 [Ramlibacter sp.]|jgi:hypothetical protein